MAACFFFTLQKLQGTMIKKNHEMIRLMNEYGAARQPFLFVIDFDCEEPVVIPLEEAASSGIYYQIGDKGNYLPREIMDTPLEFNKLRLKFKT